MNPDIFVIPIVLLAVFYLAWRIRNNKKGISGCGCDDCPSFGECGSDASSGGVTHDCENKKSDYTNN